MSRKLRILTIGHSYCVALNRAFMRELARDSDVDITLAAPSFFHDQLRPIEIEPEPADSQLRVAPLRTRWSRHVHVFNYDDHALRSLVQHGDFDIVHAWEEPYIAAGYQIARAVQRTSARFCFRTAQSYVKRYPPPFAFFERKVLARAQGWIAGGRLVRQAMLRRGFPSESGRTMSLAVDTTVFQPLCEGARTTVRDQLGLTGTVVGFVGRLTKAKGLDILMSALEHVHTSQEWSLLLLGGGDYEEKILAWAERRGWSDRMKIKLVPHSEVPRYVGCMDVLVAPSQSAKNWREQFGRMLVEAFACGVPVIASDSGEIPFVVGDAGKIVGERDVAAWARALEKFICDREARADFGRRGLVRANQFSVTTIAAQYRDYFQWLDKRPVLTS